MNRWVSRFISVFLILFSSVSYYSQDAEVSKDKSVWSLLGLGVNSIGGPGASVIIGGNIGIHSFSVGGNFSEEFTGLIFGTSPPKRAGEVNLLYGITGEKERLKASFLLGVGNSFGVKRGNYIGSYFGARYEKITYSAIGVSLMGQIFLKPKEDGLGIGIHVYSNINKEQSFVGSSLCCVFYFD